MSIFNTSSGLETMSNYFKVVMTKEKKGIYFSAVPHGWEVNKILFWPDHLMHSQREKLRSAADSIPEETWTQLPCIVKTTNIKTFKEALLIEQKLTQCSDTDAEEELFKKMTQKESASTSSVFFNNRNQLFQNIDILQLDDAQVVFNQNNSLNSEIIELPIETNENDVKNELVAIKMNVLSIKNEIETLRNDFKIQNTKLNLTLDKIFSILSKNNNIESKAETNERNNVEENLINDLKLPLTSVNEIEKFNKEVCDNKLFKKQLIAFLSKMFGSSGEEDGTKIGYKLVDTLFSPHLLVNYTWTGVSRKKEEKKSFQQLDGIVDLFLTVISLADRRFTRQKTINLFKDGVLKHAKQRCLRKRTANINPIDENDNEISNEEEYEEGQGDSISSEIQT